MTTASGSLIRQRRILKHAKVAALAAGVTAVVLVWTAAIASGASFDRRPLPLATDKLFDMDVVDFDLDGDLDAFTVNHKYPQTLLANEGSGRWNDVFHVMGLEASPAFPGLEDLRHPPHLDEEGAYLFGKDRGERTHVELANTDPEQTFSGDLSFLLPVETKRIRHGSATVTEVPGAPTRFRLDFAIEPGGSMVIKIKSTATAFASRVDLNLPASSIFVGSDAVNPSSNEFTLRLADRHGMAWGDYDGDGAADVFIASGGAHGSIRRFPGAFSDELRLRNGQAFDDATAGSGLDKGACRGRSTSTVDVDLDGRLDLFESCKGDSSPRLWTGDGNGGFTDASELLNGHAGVEMHRWVDLNGDRWPDLITADPARVTLLIRRDDRFVTRRSFHLRGTPNGITVADPDNDGRPDLFVAYSGESALIHNTAHGFERASKQQLGLPRGGAEAAAWVDYDNDGTLDLHLVPRGIFRQRQPWDFVRTGLARSPTRSNRDKAIVSWADLNGDGTRDLLQYDRTHNGSRAFELINRHRSGHWLEVDLRGSPGNRQAVGAEVTVRAGTRHQVQWVGQHDTSRYSQGHYRLYYGLGHRRKPVTVSVRWPDGATTHLDDVGVDRLITTSH